MLPDQLPHQLVRDNGGYNVNVVPRQIGAQFPAFGTAIEYTDANGETIRWSFPYEFYKNGRVSRETEFYKCKWELTSRPVSRLYGCLFQKIDQVVSTGLRCSVSAPNTMVHEYGVQCMLLEALRLSIRKETAVRSIFRRLGNLRRIFLQEDEGTRCRKATITGESSVVSYHNMLRVQCSFQNQ